MARLLDKLKAFIAPYTSGEKRISFTSCVIVGAIVTTVFNFVAFHPEDSASCFWAVVFGVIIGLPVGYLIATVLAFFVKLRM